MVQVCKYRRGTVTLNDVDFNGNTASDKITHQFSLTFEHDRRGILGNRCSDAEPHVLQRVQHGSTHNPRWIPIVYGHGWDWPELDRKVNTTEGVTGWTAYLSRRDQSYNRRWIQHQDDGKHLYYRDNDRL
jgi:hypothetical protein